MRITHPFTGLSVLALFAASIFLLALFTESGDALSPLPSALGDSASIRYKKSDLTIRRLFS